MSEERCMKLFLKASSEAGNSFWIKSRTGEDKENFSADRNNNNNNNNRIYIAPYCRNFRGAGPRI